MKITTLNVRNFGLGQDKPLWDKIGGRREYKLEMEAFQTSPQRRELVERLAQELLMVPEKASDIFAFQEFDVNAPAGQMAVGLFRDCGYMPIYPDTEMAEGVFGNSSITMMFAKKTLQVMPVFSPAIKQWRWCVAKVEGIKIANVHAPLEKAFFNALLDYTRKASTQNQKLVVLGDLNCHRGKASTYREHLLKMEEHLCDLVPDDAETYFPGHTTIDHVLVSPALKDSGATARVYKQSELELSDHAVIVVDLPM